MGLILPKGNLTVFELDFEKQTESGGEHLSKETAHVPGQACTYV